MTDKDGKFELKTLPPGTYTIEAWHEKLGAQEQKVTIGEKEDEGGHLHASRRRRRRSSQRLDGHSAGSGGAFRPAVTGGPDRPAPT